MAVLFDSFSYRIKEVESGICYDRWHFGKYPELTMPEHLYYPKIRKQSQWQSQLQ